MSPTRPAHTLISITALLALAALAAGCGDDTEAPEGGAKPATDSPSSETSTAAAPDPGDVTAFCEAYEVLSQIDPAAPDPDQLRANLIAFTWATTRAAEAAAPEIRDSAQVLADRFPDYVSLAEKADYRPAKKQVIAFFSADDVASAGAEMDAFSETNCDS